MLGSVIKHILFIFPWKCSESMFSPIVTTCISIIFSGNLKITSPKFFIYNISTESKKRKKKISLHVINSIKKGKIEITCTLPP